MSLGDDYGDGQTRTRMPERNELPPRRGRGGGRSSRGLVTGVGVIVLLIAAIAFANRDSDDTAGGDNAPATSPTAPTGERPVASGFAHDEQGAQSAAANYAVTLVSADILKPAQRAEIVQRLFVAEKQEALAAKFDAAYDVTFLEQVGLDENGNPAPGQTYISRTVPVGTKVTDHQGDRATVEVWCTGVFGTAGDSSVNPVTNDWFTMELGLRWAEDDWKVESFAQKEGPAPVNSDNKVATAEQISKAVDEFGGFTYAR
ncbi:hypothetical protein [Streptomyces sp. UH6]|uniref:hypothetical protein n=1 Tax=Streptomyces sp. UH6 TaxID=2748379 RepID=UPI0015D4D866|nr:hypothetical protein [Streptomyces sp. UH6]NYV75412.1 hypothetical protein [Streptomyces sp. UH6]